MRMKYTQNIERAAGILMAVSSLPSNYGIGTFGQEAYKFVDFVHECHHGYWQVLPLGPTTYGDSPYQAYSAFAGNPYFIDLDMLVDEGYISLDKILEKDWGDGNVPVNVSEDEAKYGNYPHNFDVNLGHPNYVSYEKLFNARLEVLKQAHKGFCLKRSESKARLAKGLPLYKRFDNFMRDNAFWIRDYSLFMALKEKNEYKSWLEWDIDIQKREAATLEKVSIELEEEIDFWNFIQFEFASQWSKLKSYANQKDVKIIGDIPIYVGLDSVDVWAHSDLFLLDENLTPTKVAGVPPDAFSDLGQKWGNPIYDYKKMKADGFEWWRKRIEKNSQLYDVIRIDHFLGIVKYYTIPAQNPDAREGAYEEGPGQDLLDVINEAKGDTVIIAEDLGVSLPEVAEILEYNDYPSMKVLEFAFGGDRKNPHLPYNYPANCVVYGGTHDNETLMGFLNDRGDCELGYAFDYLDTRDRRRMVDMVFREAYGSVAKLAIFTVQDILKLGNEARMNTPSSMGNNWKWRMSRGQLGEKEVNDMRYLASVFGRETY